MLRTKHKQAWEKVKCPYCGSNNVTASDYGEHNYNSMSFGHECMGCERVFTSIWNGNPYGKFSHFEDENGNEIGDDLNG